MRRKLLFVFAGLGMVAQTLVPTWMLLKHHLILTRGEKVTLDVTFYDPRDLFMGHYVRLSIDGEIPEPLKGVPNNYLRYYCDQRYAKLLDKAVRGEHKAELDVRVWRGSALAEELRINGMPAYAYVEQKGLSPEKKEEDRTRPLLENVLSVDAGIYNLVPTGRLVVVGTRLKWNKDAADEGLFFKNTEDEKEIPAEIVEVFKEGFSYLIRPKTPLPLNKTYKLVFYYRKDSEKRQASYLRQCYIHPAEK